LTLLRWLSLGAIALMLAITSSSAYIRLNQAGIGCTDWPACYRGSGDAASRAAPDSDGLTIARGLHRVSASLAGLWVIAAALLCWRAGRSAGVRAALLALVALAAGLAWLGVHTPSTLPAVTLANLLGGMTMLAVASWLFGRSLVHGGDASRGRSAAGAALPCATALTLVYLQLILGGMLGARGAALECAALPLCGAVPGALGAAGPVFDPFVARIADLPGESVSAARQWLHLIHRGAAVPTLLAVLWAAQRALIGSSPARGWAAALAAVAVVQAGAGIATVAGGYAMPWALSHNVLAATLVLLLAGRLGASGSRVAEPSRMS
jgi:cytochrome c oxidase assembly protein subunit 15